MQTKGKTPEQQLREGYRKLTFKTMKDQSLMVVMKVYQNALKQYKAKPAEMDSLLIYTKKRNPELAALAVSANVLLNLDEVVTKE
jgi:hypothetical protein